MVIYCSNCGSEVAENANFCSCCGAAINQTGTVENNTGASDTAKTLATVAGVAVGASLLGNIFHRRRRPPMPPHGGMMGGPMGPGGRGHGPMGGHGGRGHGPMGGPRGMR